MPVTTNQKKSAVLKRIQAVEESLTKAKEYLENGQHANWHGFRPLFVRKFRDGKELPPHPDWVKNVFIPRREKTLRHAEKVLEKMV